MKDSAFVMAGNLSRFVNTNEGLLGGGKPVGAVLEFPGLGGGSCLGGHMDNAVYETDYTRRLADAGILAVYVAAGPWSWMNRGAIRLTEAVCAALTEKFGLSDSFPFAASGGSMGGTAALIWSMSTRFNVTGCAAACPGIDLLNHYFSDQPHQRTLFDAVASYDAPIEEGLKSISPQYRLDEMKKIPYFIVGDADDECFPIATTDSFVARMRERGLNADYRRLPDARHGEFTPEVRDALTEFLIGCFR